MRKHNLFTALSKVLEWENMISSPYRISSLNGLEPRTVNVIHRNDNAQPQSLRLTSEEIIDVNGPFFTAINNLDRLPSH
jgi:hypothetical protein